MTGDPYGSAHQALRRAMLAAAGPSNLCVRCGKPLGGDSRQVHLDHTDDGGGYLGLAHKRCNESAGGRKGNQRKAERAGRRDRVAAQVAEVAVALEISHDRSHAALVSAGYLPGGLILVTLDRYLDYGGDSAELVAAVVELGEALAVVVDPHSPGATCIRPLEVAKVKVTRPTSADLAVAHGGWLDALAAGRVRHQRQPTLTAAMAHLEQRRLGGATAPERRGAAVDVAPAVAAELSVWALETLPAPADPFAILGP